MIDSDLLENVSEKSCMQAKALEGRGILDLTRFEQDLTVHMAAEVSPHAYNLIKIMRSIAHICT